MASSDARPFRKRARRERLVFLGAPQTHRKLETRPTSDVVPCLDEVPLRQLQGQVPDRGRQGRRQDGAHEVPPLRPPRSRSAPASTESSVSPQCPRPERSRRRRRSRSPARRRRPRPSPGHAPVAARAARAPRSVRARRRSDLDDESTQIMRPARPEPVRLAGAPPARRVRRRARRAAPPSATAPSALRAPAPPRPSGPPSRASGAAGGTRRRVAHLRPARCNAVPQPAPSPRAARGRSPSGVAAAFQRAVSDRQATSSARRSAAARIGTSASAARRSAPCALA